MPAAIAIDDLVAESLRSPHPEAELRGAVRALLASGYDRDELARELNRYRLELAANGKEREEAILFDVLDALAGWCAPDGEL